MPKLCFVCQESLPSHRRRICASCFEELSLLDPINRCPFCFEEREGSCSTPCPCRAQKEYPFFIGFCFHPLPAALWLKHDLLSKTDDMVQGTSALIQLQLLSLRWPKPDIIVPYGSQNAHLISCHISKAYSCQKYHPIFRKKIEDKTVLIIAPHISSRKEITPFVEKMIHKYPKRIFVLGLTHS